MSSLCWRVTPVNGYDIQGLELWLEEMAQTGLFLHHFSAYQDMAAFRRDTPQTVRYRLDPTDAKGIDSERNSLYAQAGWELVDVIPSAFYIFSCDDPAAPELHTDPATLAYALRRVIRRYIRRHLLFFGVILVLLGVLLAQSGQTVRLDIILGCSSLLKKQGCDLERSQPCHILQSNSFSASSRL